MPQFSKRLYSRLALAMLLLFALLAAIVLGVNHHSSRLHVLEVTQSVNRDIALHAAEDMPLWENNQPNAAAVKELAHHIMLINPIVEVYLLSADGEVLAHALPDQTVVLKRVDLNPIHAFLGRQQALPIFADDPRDPANRKIFSVSPILQQGQTVAYLYTVLNGQSYRAIRDSLADNQALRSGSVVLAAALLLAVLSGLLVFFRLTRPLSILHEEVESYRKEMFKGRIPPPGSHSAADEISELRRVLSDMSQRIEQQFAEIDAVDSARRELIANVSHDIRTPLSAMQGYLETVLFKRASLDQEELDQYLQIAHRHSRRLNNLVGELFELAKLESPGLQLNREVFPILELMHDLIQEQALAASEKGIRLSIDSQSEPASVCADIALVHRALDNLLSNAMKHTPRGGQITLSATADEGQIRLCVSDNGCGIPEAQLPYIFERFYHDEHKQGEAGNGLGLAIVKKIVELHDMQIRVQSTLHQGTIFTFWLIKGVRAVS